jgi:hypothetical protein
MHRMAIFARLLNVVRACCIQIRQDSEQSGPVVRNLTVSATCFIVLSVSALMLCLPTRDFAQGVDDLTKEEKPGDLDILDDLNEGKKQSDLAGMRLSHLSLIDTWQAVRPESPAKDDKQTYHWSASRGTVTPLGDQPISTLIQVPEKGKYRVYLRHVLSMVEKRPVTFKLKPVELNVAEPDPVAVVPADALSHQFGTTLLLEGEQGKEQESKLPIRVESQLQLNTIPDREMPVWEYWDVELARGAYQISLETKKTNVQVSAVFLTPSLNFRPSFSQLLKDNTLQSIFLRFRPTKPMPKRTQYSVSAGLTYHWPRATPSGQPSWGQVIGSAAEIPGDEWSPFINATDAIVPGPGPWSTCRVGLQNIRDGQIEVQVAWFPHDAAVVHSLTTDVAGGQIMFRVPHGPLYNREPAKKPRWGIWNLERLKEFIPEEELVANYFKWATTAAAEMGLKEDHPLPKNLLFLSSCRVNEAHREHATEMLARLGVNWVDGASTAVVKRLGLYDGSRMTKVLNGDEISTYTSASTVNSSPLLIAEFRAYLQQQAELQDTTVRTLFGVPDLGRLNCLADMPENPGRFERRLYYHSHRFCHQATIAEYAKTVKDAEAQHKNAAVYNNYSPHPVFLTGDTMNGVDWFLLCRAGAQTLGWGEDWATGGSWGLGTDRTQCVTFYAAIVEASVRKRGYPSGFYVGSNCGFSANKIFSCVSEGIDIMHLYDWGPIDAWAEGSNSWSEAQGEYKSVLIGTHALGPADEIIAKGQRERRRTAVLYNRAHEIMNHRTVWLNHDWMWTFLAMKSAQIPVDLIIEEDLTAEELGKYEVLYLGGLNLEQRHLKIVANWVKNGGLLIGSGGSAMYDAYNNLNPETVELFGARQTVAPAAVSASASTAADENVTFTASDVFPAATFKISAPGGHHYLLEPTTGQSLGEYAEGSCAAVSQKVGKGRTILLGFYPGHTYQAAGRALGPVQPWLVQPVLAHLGRQRAEFNYPASEVTLFEHPTGLAVMLNNFTPYSVKPSIEPTKLSIATERKITNVSSALRGPLKWKRVGDRIEIETPSAADLIVDTIILK